MIKNIIFDMGNVLIDFDKDGFIRRLGIEDESDRRLLMREVFQTVEWARLDRGSLLEADAVKIMCTRLPERLHDAAEKLVQMWDRPILPIDGVYEIVEKLYNAGYKIFLLSNASSRQHEYWPRIPASRFFTDTLVSADVLLCKPEKEIYELALKKFGIRADESVFIDDSVINAEGAYRTGIDAIVFHGDAAELTERLREREIDI